MSTAKKTAKKAKKSTKNTAPGLKEALSNLAISAALLRSAVGETARKHRRGEHEEVRNAFPEFEHALREIERTLRMLARDAKA